MATKTDERRGVQAGTDRNSGVWVQQTRAFTTRYARQLFRTKAVLFWTMAFPAGFYLLTIMVTIPDEAFGANEAAIKATIAVSYGMFGAIIAALNSFTEQLGSDVDEDRYVQYRALSIAPTADLAGRMTAGVVLTAVAFGFVLVVAVVTGASFSPKSAATPLLVAGTLLTFAVFWMVLAVCVAVFVRDRRYASIITVSVAMIAYMLTGYNGTNPTMYHGPEALLNFMPHTLATRLIADQLVTGAGAGLAPPAVPATLPGFGLMTVYAGVTLVAGVAVMRAVLYKRTVIP